MMVKMRLINDNESGQHIGVLGPHGHGELNDAGEELQHSEPGDGIHKATWQQPGQRSGIALIMQ